MTSFKLLLTPLYLWSEQNRSFIFRVADISGVILAGFVMVPQIILGGRFPVLLLFLYLILIIAIVFLRWPALGLIAVILSGMLIPVVGPSGVNAAVGLVAFMLVLWLLKMMMEQRTNSLVGSRTILPLFAFLIVSLFSFALGQLPWFQRAQRAPLDAQIGGFSIFILSVGAFLLVAHLVTELRWLKAMTWVFIAFGAIYVLGRIIPGCYTDRIYHLGFSAGSMFWTWLVALLVLVLSVPSIALWQPTTLTAKATIERMAPSSAEDAATEDAQGKGALEEEYGSETSSEEGGATEDTDDQ